MDFGQPFLAQQPLADGGLIGANGKPEARFGESNNALNRTRDKVKLGKRGDALRGVLINHTITIQ